MSIFDHPDWRDLLRAVLAAPEDDLPRLVLADWLDEHGEHERAEFIRLQIRLAELRTNPRRPKDGMELLGWQSAIHQNESVIATVLGDGVCKCELCLVKRERELWEGGIQDGFRSVLPAALSRGPALAIVVRRGFVDEFRCTMEDWCGRWETVQVTRLMDRVERGVRTLYTPGVGPTVVTAHPVRRVVVTDRRADSLNFRRITGSEYRWWESGRGPEGRHTAAELPKDVFDILWETPGVVRQQAGIRNRCVGYASPSLADAALSAGLLTWAGKRAEVVAA